MTAVEAIHNAIAELIKVIPDDAAELLACIEERGFVLIPKQEAEKTSD